MAQGILAPRGGRGVAAPAAHVMRMRPLPGDARQPPGTKTPRLIMRPSGAGHRGMPL